MKKIISLLLCVALLCSMVVVVAHADDEPQVQVANAVAIPGASVTLDLNIANNPGLAAVRLTVTDTDALGATFVGADNVDDALGFTANDAQGIYFWSGSADVSTPKMGTLTIEIPEEAEAGKYTFSVVADGAVTANKVFFDIAAATFTITVTDKVIDGVNVAIDAGTAIGVHVQTSDPDNTSITAVTTSEITYEEPEIDEETGEAKTDEETGEPVIKSVTARWFTTITDYEEDEENGGYFYYLNVNPWDMDVEFIVDFTENFTINDQETEDDKDDVLDTNAIPGTAKTVGILNYCEKVKGTSDELDQLIADLLAFGQQAQIYNGAAEPSYALPEGLEATEGAWVDGDENPCNFGDYCSANFPEDQTGKNATAKKKFEFDYVTIEFGSKFVATFTFKNGATATASNLARVKVNGETYSLDGWDFTYAFSPAEYAGVEFDLYAAANTSATNFAWINNYGPAHFAAYLNDNYGEEAADILAVLEAFYNYGVSVEAYVATLG